jgi:hypothetical protein
MEDDNSIRLFSMRLSMSTSKTGKASSLVKAGRIQLQERGVEYWVGR